MSATERRASGAIEILGLPLPELRRSLGSFLRERGEPEFRIDQIAGWTFARNAVRFDEMSNLPAGLRRSLAESFSLTPLEAAFTSRSSDGTVKHLWVLEDGEQVESVLIPSGGRITLCLSSQAGCALACRFCATGYFGFRRQLRAAEIAAQYRDSLRASLEEFAVPISNVVYMGMGEPLANLDALLVSLRVLHEGFGLGARRITVSTVGLVPGIRALARRPEPFRLAVSLHAPNHELRLRLVPVERRHPLPELFEALREYHAATRRRITFEYVMIRGLNDDPGLAEELADLLTGLSGFVNLIPFNPIPEVGWEPAPRDRIEAFARLLGRKGVPAAVRQPRGREIAAACGQLRLERERAAVEGDHGAPPAAASRSNATGQARTETWRGAGMKARG
ncbi:MAG: 23S rRNA (adenine(2503)-C(2))-methyltransferase RlmN [Gemmatimonadota bacterium]